MGQAVDEGNRLAAAPFFSMRSFATSARDRVAGRARLLHLQSRCGQPHPGHLPPVSVE